MSKKTRAERNLKFETLQLHVGQENPDPATGARAVPIYQTSSFVFNNSDHAAARFGLQDAGNIYGRLTNPTEDVFEQRMAALEGGVAALAVASGAAAINYTIINLAQKGDHIVSAKNIYGGSYNLLAHTLPQYGISTTFVDVFDLDEVRAAVQDNTKAIYIETPTNPMMNVTDIRKMADIAKRHNLILIVDNTFMSPYFQNPLDLGADVVIHSGTKYLSGHNDTLAGFIVTNREDIQEKLRFLIKTTGAGLAPFDCWLVLRGMKTLGIRMERSQENAEQIATWLQKQKAVTKVIYPGLPDHPGHEIMKKQARGFGAMLTIQLESKEFALAILEKVRMIRFAESLGGVETLVTYPTTQTHADVPKEIRERNGITESTLRFSVGIENIEDLIGELEKVFAEIEEEKNDGKKS